ncbi:MAG: zinc ribbon domain-containing protein [Gammaproteobacteria bacterium]|nr:zinc ribbon domain-containing protein [Gammaproteobacteria bacterium]
MPIYEFYCSDCHTIYNFFSRRVNTEKRPDCPQCERTRLKRRISLFNLSKGRKGEDDDPMAGLDEEHLEKALMSMAGELEGIDENDPRQAARMMRRLFDATGMDPGQGLEEAVQRMEAGEDPDKIEAEMGELQDGEEQFSMKGKKGLKELQRRFLPPKVDETFHEL